MPIMWNELEQGNFTLFIEYATFVNAVTFAIPEKFANHCSVNQIQRSSSSIMANYAESLGCATPKDCANKMSIALKEAYETKAWAQLMYNLDILDFDNYKSIIDGAENIIEGLQKLIVKCVQSPNPTTWQKHLRMKEREGEGNACNP